jgi:hypothetical protein
LAAFHGEAELFRSNHADAVHTDALAAPCRVLGIEAYKALSESGGGGGAAPGADFYARYHFAAATDGAFTPRLVPVLCSCKEPENPDRFMATCDRCRLWFHPVCEGGSERAVRAPATFHCARCMAKMRARAAEARGGGGAAAAADAGVAAAAAAGPAEARGDAVTAAAVAADDAGAVTDSPPAAKRPKLGPPVGEAGPATPPATAV